MFGLFNRGKKQRAIQDWEKELLINTIKKLPSEYNYLEYQITSNLLVTSLIGYSSYNPNYVAFSFNQSIINDFENNKEKDYRITNIKVFDNNSKKDLIYTIYVSAGVLSGYSIKKNDEFNIDVNKIDVNSFIKLYFDSNDFKTLSKILNSKEVNLLNPNDVYKIKLKGETYYHVCDVEDGDFIGISLDKKIYQITHDPFQVILLNENIEQIMNYQR